MDLNHYIAFLLIITEYIKAEKIDSSKIITDFYIEYIEYLRLYTSDRISIHDIIVYDFTPFINMEYHMQIIHVLIEKFNNNFMDARIDISDVILSMTYLYKNLNTMHNHEMQPIVLEMTKNMTRKLQFLRHRYHQTSRKNNNCTPEIAISDDEKIIVNSYLL